MECEGQERRRKLNHEAKIMISIRKQSLSLETFFLGQNNHFF